MDEEIQQSAVIINADNTECSVKVWLRTGREGENNIDCDNLKQNEAQSAHAESTHKGVN